MNIIRRIWNSFYRRVSDPWIRFWMLHSGLGFKGRLSIKLASWFIPPHKAAVKYAYFSPNGYISPAAQIYHNDLNFGKNVFIGDRVIIYQESEGGPVNLGNRVCFLRDSILETGFGGMLSFGDDAYIHPRCQFNAHKGSIHIGKGVMIASNCAFYPHDHGMIKGIPIREQPLQTRGDIAIGDNAWLATGVIVLGGVQIGKGAIIGAGAVVTKSIPENAIAIGIPAQVVKMRPE